MSNRNLAFLQGRRARILSAILLLHAAAMYSFSRKEILPTVPPLQDFPSEIGPWTVASEVAMTKQVFESVKPDDYLIRSYARDGDPAPVSLSVAYFRTQRTGHLPHSPKNCLPGRGWVPAAARVVDVVLPGGGSMKVNRYIVQKGDDKALVLYWYQSWNRVDANEYVARAHLLTDAIRYNRTDTALVRVTIPVTQDERAIEIAAIQFSQLVYSLMQRQLPVQVAAL